MPETTDKDREEARREEFEMFGCSLYDLDKCSTTNRYATKSTQIAWENWVSMWTRISAKAKAEALMEAAERADEAIVRWADPIYIGDIPAEVSELRYKVEHAITHADEPQAACTWTEDPEGYWSTSCGRSWTFIEGGPEANRVNYCHGCGNPVRIADEPNKEE